MAHGNSHQLLDFEREHILNPLRQCRGNRTHTARSLGISVRGLRIKLASYAEMALTFRLQRHLYRGVGQSSPPR